MLRLILQRLLYSIPVLVLLTFVLFLSIKLIPGDIALVIAGERATPEKLLQIRETLHLNDPWYVQYGSYLWGLVAHLDLGRSMFHDLPITELLGQVVPATVELATCALLIAFPVAVALGVLCAVYRRSWIDKFCTVLALGGVSMPIFWLALLLTYFFSIRWGLLPTSGRLSDEVNLESSQMYTHMYTLDGLIMGLQSHDWSVFKSAVEHIVLPAVALSTIPMAYIMRMTRATFVEVLGQDYIRTAKAKGLSPLKVVFKHAFRNALPQIVTVTALQAGYLFGGAVLTETIFAWPGLGRALIESISNRDFPMIQSGTLFVGAIFVFFNLAADILYAALDPRAQNRMNT